MRLSERSRVKDLLQMARADTLYDRQLNGMIEQASEEVETITRRTFDYRVRVEYHRSYEQSPIDPDPQYIHLEAMPIDLTETLELAPGNPALSWAQTPTPNYTVYADKGVIAVTNPGRIGFGALPYPYAGGIGYDPRGFKVTYTGGYPTLDKPPLEEDDPLDDYGFVQVPEALRSVIARKVADDWKNAKQLLPWSDDQRSLLKTWTRRDTL
jgi:hypothetical protein